MTIYGIGIDVVEVSRIHASLNEFGEQFIKRIFTQREREYCEKQQNREIHYAARFAAKEAVSKAFGTGIGQSIGWTEIEILRKASGEPAVHLHGKAALLAQKIGAEQVKISLTHAQHYAAANSVILCLPLEDH